MPNYLEIAKLRSHNLSQRSIASSLNLSRNTVSNVFTIMDQNHIDYEGLLQMSPQQIHGTVLSDIRYADRINGSGREPPGNICH